MKTVSIDSEVWFLSTVDDMRPIKGLSLVDVVRGVGQRYEFAATPTTLPQKDQGLVFQEGTFRADGRSVAIRKMELYQDGTHLVVASDSDDADLVWQDLRSWTISIGGPPDVKPVLHYHVSAIVCEFSNSIDNLISNFAIISEMISSKLDIKAPINLRGLTFSADPFFQVTKVNPTLFTIEPRDQVEFARNKYFCFANMTTRNHLDILQWLDSQATKTE